MRAKIILATGAFLLAACEPAGPDMAGLCRTLMETEPQVSRMLGDAGAEAKPTCDCYAKLVRNLPEPQRTAVRQGLSDMIAERDARGLDMEGVYALYRDGTIPLDEKTYTPDDLNEAGELLEEAAEGVIQDGACPA